MFTSGRLIKIKLDEDRYRTNHQRNFLFTKKRRENAQKNLTRITYRSFRWARHGDLKISIRLLEIQRGGQRPKKGLSKNSNDFFFTEEVTMITNLENPRNDPRW